MTMRTSLQLVAVASLFGAVNSDAAFWNKKGDRSEAEEPTIEVVSVPDTVSPGIAAPAATPSAAPQRRAHFLVKDSETEKGLMQLAESRRQREEEIRVILRLYEEKQGELARMNGRLTEKFGISAEENYQYDNETKSLYKLTPKEGAEDLAQNGQTAPEDLFDKKLHMSLELEDMEVTFVRLVSAKKITASELQVLQLLLKEKNMELAKIHASLKERFSILPEKHYEYDADAHTLFEIVQADSPAMP